ncbi:MAG TPA: TldD/PmbA family protein, partial [Clostridia bacterium]|nr:TldD/PmbA family protein [Clostridia bacterium]
IWCCGSVAGPNMNKMVASPLVSMTDFAHTAFGEKAPLPVYVDDEGVLAEDAELIRNGKLVGYMVNRELGRHFNMRPQGNARAFGFNDEPLIRMRNTAIHPGISKLSDMISQTEDGYYLINTNNGQADTTGEFMFGVTIGYEIKNGRLGRAIFDTTISGVAFEMLKTVDMVSDTVTWASSGFCGKKQPMTVGMGGPELRCQVIIGGK